MAAALLGLCLVSAPLVFLDGSTGGDPAADRAVLDAVAQAVALRLDADPQQVVRTADCAEGDACPLGLEGEPRLVVRTIAAVTRTRVLLRVIGGASAQVDLGPDRASWGDALAPALGVILPEAAVREASSGARWARWGLVAAGVGSAAVGVGFALSSASAHDALEVGRPSAETRALREESAGHATAANALWIGAAVGLGAAVLWAVLDP